MNSVFSIDNFKNNPIKHAIPVLLSFTFLCILIDMISGFQGMHLAWSDIWHHRAVLLALSENPLSPGNPHIASDVGSRSYTPIYLILGWIGYYTGASANILLSFSLIIAFSLNYLGSRHFLASLGWSKHLNLFLFIMLFAWLYPPNYTGFHNLRSLIHTASYPGFQAFGLTLLTWGAYIKWHAEKQSDFKALTGITTGIWLTILTHQFTALFCLGGLVLFTLLEAPENWLRKAVLLCISSALTISTAFLWPYFDLSTVLLSASNTGWQAEEWFYDPIVIIMISTPTLIGTIIALFTLKHDRQLVIFALGASVIFTAYLMSRMLGVEAGHRLLPFWIFFLQLVCMKWVLAETLSPRIHKIRRAFLYSLIVLASAQITASIIDTQRLRLKNHGIFGLEDPHTDFSKILNNLEDKLPHDAVIIAYEETAYPVQGYGINVVSIPREAPMILDLAERQNATHRFFEPNTTCEERQAIISKYKITHAAYVPSELPEYFVSNILRTVENSLIYRNGQLEIIELTSLKKCMP
jgi:hypothetical protein